MRTQLIETTSFFSIPVYCDIDCPLHRHETEGTNGLVNNSFERQIIM